ncbi:MAG: glucokinase [Polyangiales bacterium]
MNVLVGDIGGTKTALGLYESTGEGGYKVVAENTYASHEHKSLMAVLNRFLPTSGSKSSIDTAVFSVAGPVQNGVSSTTNLPWVISEHELSTSLGTQVALINDFFAVALGVRELPSAALRVLQAGTRDPRGAFAVIGAGTGLGEAVGVPLEDGGVRVLPGEGGHTDFAPRDEIEWRLYQYLRSQHEHVSVERVVSGLGLSSLYDFVVTAGLAPADPETRRRFATESHGAVISERAKQDPAAARALALFVSAYGAEAGNLALKVLPVGGLYVAGGIAARLVDQLDWDAFLNSFHAKGRMGQLLKSIPIAVVREPNVGLLGARAYAALLWRSRTLH